MRNPGALVSSGNPPSLAIFTSMTGRTLPGPRCGMEKTISISFEQGDNFNCDSGRKEGNYLLSGGGGRCWETPSLPAKAPIRPRQFPLRTAFSSWNSARPWNSAAWGTVVENGVIAGVERPLDSPARFQGRRIIWKLHGDFALRVNGESWAKGWEKPRKPSPKAGPK